MKESTEICKLIKQQNAHIYVCGDVQMAENVFQTLRWLNLVDIFLGNSREVHKNFFFFYRKIIAISEKQSEAVAEKYMLQLRVMYSVQSLLNCTNSIWIYNFWISQNRMKIAITKIFSG